MCCFLKELYVLRSCKILCLRDCLRISNDITMNRAISVQRLIEDNNNKYMFRVKIWEPNILLVWPEHMARLNRQI